MPAKDKYHEAVRTALEKEDWTITADPLHIPFDETDLYIDIGAEKLLAAEKHGEKIAIEIKSFSSISVLYDFHLAVGQFINYRVALDEVSPDRKLYLAVPIETYDTFFRRRFVQSVIEREHLNIIVYDAVKEVITEWKS
ncbi:MAG: XisH family protein [Aridibacter sp.]